MMGTLHSLSPGESKVACAEPMHHLLKCLQQNELLVQAEGIKLLFENEVSKIRMKAHFLEAGAFFSLFELSKVPKFGL